MSDVVKQKIKEAGEIAIGTLITLGVAIGGSYLFTFDRTDRLNDKFERQNERINADLYQVNRKIDALLIKEGIDPLKVLSNK